jgi:hypothetical protein
MLRGAAFNGAAAASAAANKGVKIILKASSSQAGTSFLRDLGDDLARGKVDLRFGQGLSARLQGDGNRNRFFAFSYAFAFVDIEYADIGDESAIGRGSGLHNVGGIHGLVADESKVALHRHEFRNFELRFGLCGPQFRRRYVIEDELETSDRPLGAEVFEGAGMELADGTNDIFWPQLDRRRTDGMKPRRPAWDEAQTIQ